jgi:hypothetical protein
MRPYLRMGPLLLGVLCWAGIGMTASHAEDSAKKTTLTINTPTQMPGTTLAAGTYVFKQSGEQSGWNIVQVYNQDESSLVSTLLAYPNPNLVSNGQAFLLYPQSIDSQTQVMEAFFFDGDPVAQQLAYPKKTADQIGATNHVRVPTTGTDDAYPSSLPAAASSWSARVNQDAPPDQTSSDPPQAADRPAQSADVPAASTSTAKSEALPQTASPLPLIGLIGLLAVVGIVVLRRISRTS